MKQILTIIAILLVGKFTAIAAEPNISGVWLVGDKDYKIELKRVASGEIEGKNNKWQKKHQ